MLRKTRRFHNDTTAPGETAADSPNRQPLLTVQRGAWYLLQRRTFIYRRSLPAHLSRFHAATSQNACAAVHPSPFPADPTVELPFGGACPMGAARDDGHRRIWQRRNDADAGCAGRLCSAAFAAHGFNAGQRRRSGRKREDVSSHVRSAKFVLGARGPEPGADDAAAADAGATAVGGPAIGRSQFHPTGPSDQPGCDEPDQHRHDERDNMAIPAYHAG